jgi:hypothetical protein
MPALAERMPAQLIGPWQRSPTHFGSLPMQSTAVVEKSFHSFSNLLSHRMVFFDFLRFGGQ